jgi:cytoskeletal protein CcmA (bactofilin family)
MLNRKRSERTPTNQDTSLIARSTLIQGDVRFSGALHLDGQITGSVLADEHGAVFTLSESGQVQGEIRVPHAIINGQVRGDIYASERLELAPEARVTGDVHYLTLEMAAGAQVNGRMSHQAAQAPRELPAPALDGAEAVPA